MTERPYQICSKTVMDTIGDPDITFDDKGVCNYYYEFINKLKVRVPPKEEASLKLNQLVEKIKKDGKGKQYDCIIGISGGVDSTYTAWLVKKLGLRPLAIHLDNGWNSELAVMNIQSIVEKCGFDLYTYVIDWDEFRDIQLAYFKANVIDIEAITYIAIFSALDIICKGQKIKHIIDGRNVVTEVTLPQAWICKNSANLKDIHKKYGKVPLKSYPIMSPIRRRIVAKTRPFQSWPLLNYVDYQKEQVKKVITDELGWRDYGGKHYESVFTRFYQGYILPNKFKVDKRKAHLSNLIFSGQMTKVEALKELAEPIYPIHLLQGDIDFVCKKLGMSKVEFQEYLETPPVAHDRYEMSISIFDEYPFLKPFKSIFRK